MIIKNCFSTVPDRIAAILWHKPFAHRPAVGCLSVSGKVSKILCRRLFFRMQRSTGTQHYESKTLRMYIRRKGHCIIVSSVAQALPLMLTPLTTNCTSCRVLSAQRELIGISRNIPLLTPETGTCAVIFSVTVILSSVCMRCYLKIKNIHICSTDICGQANTGQHQN